MMDIHPEYQKTKPRPIILPLILWLGVILAMIVILAGLSGCATKEEPRQEVCFFQYLGRTESGLSVAKTVCMTPEAFSESQK